MVYYLSFFSLCTICVHVVKKARRIRLIIRVLRGTSSKYYGAITHAIRVFGIHRLKIAAHLTHYPRFWGLRRQKSTAHLTHYPRFTKNIPLSS